MLKITEVSEFRTTVEIKTGHPEKPNQYITEHFTARFRILDTAELEDLTRKNRGEDESDVTRVTECLDLVFAGAENVGDAAGEAMDSDLAVAALKRRSDYALQIHGAYWRAIGKMNQTKAKN